jgi:phospholipase C
MKRLLLLVALGLSLAGNVDAQSPQFQHIIIIVQENRTPDNLFGASGLPGLDAQVNGAKSRPVSLSKGNDFNHTHAGYLAEVNGKYPERARDYVGSGADPYWDMAAQYGFANRMFQTNQGASYPAHLFLVAGSSAPSDDSDLFVFDETGHSPKYGCKAPPGTVVPTIAPDGTLGSIYPCFDRSSMIDLLVDADLTWKYYAAPRQHIWNAPDSLSTYTTSPNIVLNPPQVLNDIANGVLANVSWVTPAKAYSDHPATSDGSGPAWVASIVNAVGQSAYWPNTAIIVTWDDWGGFYDHVPPLANNTGWCTEYCYGFRVPLLVISAYTPPGYVDNNVHDFGSILHFVETNFGLGNIGPGGWADSFADDLGGFFSTTVPARAFRPIEARKLTRAELLDDGDPDDD